MDGLGPALGNGQMQRASIEIHIHPLERHDLAEPAASEDDKADGVDRRLALDAFLFALAEDLTETGQLIFREVSLTPFFRVPLDIAAGICPVRWRCTEKGLKSQLGVPYGCPDTHSRRGAFG